MNLNTSKIGLRNFRVLKNETNFELAPITLLVGPNNSGKSSVINAMKILQENLTSDGRSKVNLNEFLQTRFNTGSLRDRYGNFNEFVSRRSNDDSIEMFFSLKIFELLEEVKVKIQIKSSKHNPGEISKIEILDIEGYTLLKIYKAVELNKEPSDYIYEINFHELKKHYNRSSDLFGEWYDRVSDLDINLIGSLEMKVEQIVNDIAIAYNEFISFDEILSIIKDITNEIFKNYLVEKDEIDNITKDISDFFSSKWRFPDDWHKRLSITNIFHNGELKFDSYIYTVVIEIYRSFARRSFGNSNSDIIELTRNSLFQHSVIENEKTIIEKIKIKIKDLNYFLETTVCEEQNMVGKKIILPEISPFLLNIKYSDKGKNRNIFEFLENKNGSIYNPKFYTKKNTVVTKNELKILGRRIQSLFDFDILLNHTDKRLIKKLSEFLSNHLGREIGSDILKQDHFKIEIEEHILQSLSNLKLTYPNSNLPKFSDFGLNFPITSWNKQSNDLTFLNIFYRYIKNIIRISLETDANQYLKNYSFDFEYNKHLSSYKTPEFKEMRYLDFLIGLNAFIFLAKHNATYLLEENANSKSENDCFEEFKNNFKIVSNQTESSSDHFELFLDYIQTGLMDFHNHIRSYLEKELYFLPAIKTSLKRNLSVYENSTDPLVKLFLRSNAKGRQKNYHRILSLMEEFKISDGFRLMNDEDSGLVKLYLRKSGDKLRLFTDEGHGISQLTVLFYLLSQVNSNKYNMGSTILIEEPELSLHPSLQSKLADLFMTAAKEMGIQSIIETHSEYLVRKLQYLTAKGELKPGDVAIYYFNSEDEFKRTGEKTYRITIEQDGRLSRPFGKGFYDEASGLMIDLMNLNVK